MQLLNVDSSLPPFRLRCLLFLGSASLFPRSATHSHILHVALQDSVGRDLPPSEMLTSTLPQQLITSINYQILLVVRTQL